MRIATITSRRERGLESPERVTTEIEIDLTGIRHVAEVIARGVSLIWRGR